MSSEGRVMVVKFPYSSMKTVPQVSSQLVQSSSLSNIEHSGGAGPHQVSLLQPPQADERVPDPAAAGEEEGPVLLPTLPPSQAGDQAGQSDQAGGASPATEGQRTHSQGGQA